MIPRGGYGRNPLVCSAAVGVLAGASYPAYAALASAILVMLVG
jgi:hypothetical protein